MSKLHTLREYSNLRDAITEDNDDDDDDDDDLVYVSMFLLNLKFTGETQNCQSFTRGCDWGKLVPSSHKRVELRHTII